MKMIKKTLIAIALVAFLATSANAALSEWYLDDGDHAAVKVDGTDKPTFRWPYTVSYKSLKICNIPIKMEVGMFVQIKNCKDKKIVLKQVDCSVVGKGADKYPCYQGCVDLNVRANFPAKLGTDLHKDSDIISGWETKWDNGVNTVEPYSQTGADTVLKLCVNAWEAKLYMEDASDNNAEVAVGSVDITVKPQ
jgi:hypothetical protein